MNKPYSSSISFSNPVKFNETIGVQKQLATEVKLIGKSVPIIHVWGHDNLPYEPSWNPFKNPYLKKSISYKNYLERLRMKFASKLMGEGNLKKIINPTGIYTERIIVEKYKEIGYVPGFSNDTINFLNQKGYNRHQIAQKLGRCLLTEVHISHGKPILYPLNLLLNEGGDEIWDLLTEVNAVDYFTNALADIGTGTDNTAPVNTQTELITAPVYVGMEASFPLSTTTRRVDFKGSFGDGIAQQAWEEYSVRNSNATPKNLIRATASKGTKAAGEVWTLEIQITAS